MVSHQLTSGDLCVYYNYYPSSSHVVLPSLLPLVTSFDLCLRHGSLHGVAEVSRALCSLGTVQGQSFAEYVGKDVVQALLQVAPRVGMDG